MTTPRARAAGSLLASVAALAVWWAFAQVRVGGRQLVATPWEAVAAPSASWATLAVDLLATLGRSLLGLGVGVLGGLFTGLLCALVVKRAPVVETLLDLARSVPPVVLYPVFWLAFGFNDFSRVATIAVGCQWTMALAVTTAARAPRSGRRELLEVSGASRLTALGWTQPWESLAPLAVGLRSAASMAVIVAVVTEMVVGADHGIGAHVVSAQIAGDTRALTLDILAIAVVGWLLNRSLRALETFTASMVT